MNSLTTVEVKSATTAVAKTKLEQWHDRIDKNLINITQSFIGLGGTLVAARKELLTNEFQDLWFYVESWGLKTCDIKAAIGAYLYNNPKEALATDKRIHPDLVFCSTTNAKIMNVDAKAQGRLITEKFVTLKPSGEQDQPKSWFELSRHQKNSLIGLNGKILTPDEQGKRIRKNVSVYIIDSLQVAKNRFVFNVRNGAYRFETNLEALSKMLLEVGYKIDKAGA